jgi:hypothetical protein
LVAVNGTVGRGGGREGEKERERERERGRERERLKWEIGKLGTDIIY